MKLKKHINELQADFLELYEPPVAIPWIYAPNSKHSRHSHAPFDR